MQYEPEIGQAVFGNPTGEYDCPEFVDAFLEHIVAEIRRVYWNIHQRKWDEYNEPQIPNIVYRSYYWGECTCGWDDKICPEDHRTGCYQKDPELAYIQQVGFAIEREKVDEKYKKLCQKYSIPWDDGFGCAIHCTCDYYKRAETWFEANKMGAYGHANSCPVILPNFKFGEVGIRWYKHRGRGQSVNVDWDEKHWRQWLDKCLKQIRNYGEDECQRTSID